MPPKRFPDHSFDTVSVNGPGKRSLACNDAESGVLSIVADVENLEVLVPDIVATENMVKPVFAQQPVRGGKCRDWLIRQRVLHGLLHGVH